MDPAFPIGGNILGAGVPEPGLIADQGLNGASSNPKRAVPANENPGARSGAAGANARQTWETSLEGDYALKATLGTTFFWDGGSNSVQTIREMRRVWA
jgi:hypothetical protein